MMQNGYLELKISWQLFEKTPETLTEDCLLYTSDAADE